MCEEKQASADVQETALAELDKNILLILLKDQHNTYCAKPSSYPDGFS